MTNRSLLSPIERQNRLIAILGKVLILCVGLVAIPFYSVFLFNTNTPMLILPVPISGNQDSFSIEVEVDNNETENIVNGEAEGDERQSPDEKQHIVEKLDDGNNTDYKKEEDVSDESAFLTMYGPHRVEPSMRNLPKWLQDYFSWWQQQIQTDRNDNDNDTTKYFILSCNRSDRCGGLSDRFRYLPSILHLGSLTQRVVCIYFERPHPLESYFQPPHNGVDWRCPQHIKERVVKPSGEKDSIPVFPLGRAFLRYTHNEFKQHKDAHCYGKKITLKECADRQLKYLMTRDDLPYIVLKMNTAIDRINGYNNMFQAHSYKAKMPTILTWQHVDLTGDIFRVMFEPVEALARHINATMTRLGLVENEYTSIHMRARYPTGKIQRIMGKIDTEKYDKEGFGDFEGYDGKLKSYLLSLVSNAFHCDYLLKNAYQVAPFHNNTNTGMNMHTAIKSNGPIYLSSDFNELMDHILTHGVIIPDDDKKNQNPIVPVSSQRDKAIMHFDAHGEKGAEEYYSVMEDLLIMGGSLCVTHGIGSFGAFGAALAGNRCRAIHRPWHGNIEKCPNGRVMRKATNITKEHFMGEEIDGDGEGKLEYDERIIWD